MAIPGGPQGAILLNFFYKIHSGKVAFGKDKLPDPGSKLNENESQYTRYLDYGDALKNSFFPRTIPMCYSLPFLVVSSKTPDEFKALI